ncbi:MAG: anhydro-N-acetylmuramic acid kinase [Methylophilus sp.]|nr:anhydro-N-acetylmuramic acid kinase [Methylophilus sp.]
MRSTNLYIGIMSGTSLDGVDVCLVHSPDKQFEVLATHFLAYPNRIKSALLTLHTPSHNELEASQCLANELAVLYANAVKALLEKEQLHPSNIAAIGCHGQTIRHKPVIDGQIGFTLQIGNAALLAELTQITVVSDFRSRDIAAGGQGAPLVPAFHQSIFSHPSKHRAIINIGGIANITYLPPISDKQTPVLGFDSGPGNMLIDAWTQQHLHQDYDANGSWAAAGKTDATLLRQMMQDTFFALPPPKSTGRDLFNDAWLDHHLAHTSMQPQDVARTLVALTVDSIVDALKRFCPAVDEVYLCGGGAHNTLLRNELGVNLSGASVALTDALNVGVDWVEAAAFAWLAQQTMQHQPSNLPAVTGAKGLRILGAIHQA